MIPFPFCNENPQKAFFFPCFARYYTFSFKPDSRDVRFCQVWWPIWEKSLTFFYGRNKMNVRKKHTEEERHVFKTVCESNGRLLYL